MAIQRIPGKAERYVNTTTGETLSRRQADNIRFQALGYRNARDAKAGKKYDRKEYTRSGSVQHTYDGGQSTRLLSKRIRSTIDGSPQFGYGMYLTGVFERRDGEGTQGASTSIFKKADYEIDEMIAKLYQLVDTYQVILPAIQYYITIVDVL